MSMSDCEKCWNTPCECGHEGYLTLWIDGGPYFRSMPLSESRNQQNYDNLLKFLKDYPIDKWEKLKAEVEKEHFFDALGRGADLLPPDEEGRVFSTDGVLFAVDAMERQDKTSTPLEDLTTLLRSFVAVMEKHNMRHTYSPMQEIGPMGPEEEK